jgi:hypothetical protein
VRDSAAAFQEAQDNSAVNDADLGGVFQEPEPTAKANEEAGKIGSGEDLKADGEVKEHGRHQKFRDHVNIAALIIFWAIVVCVIFGLATFAWHFLTPESVHYLSERQLEKLQTLLGAALLSSALTQYTNKRMQ